MQILIQCNKHQQSQGQLKGLSRQCNGFTGVSKKVYSWKKSANAKNA